MGIDEIGQPRRSLSLLVKVLGQLGQWPPRDGDAVDTSEICGFAESNGLLAIILASRTRSAIETYLDREIGDDFSARILYGRLQVDFGLGPAEADRLIELHLASLLVQWMRLNASSGDERRDVLIHVATLKHFEETTPMDPDSSPVFLQALATFPCITEEDQGPPVPASEPRRRDKGRRDKGMRDKCVGAYVSALDKGETPPGPTELASLVGCDKGTAARAIKTLEERRKSYAKDDARDRYRDAN